MTWRCWNNHVNERQGGEGSNPQCETNGCVYRRFDERFQEMGETNKFEISKDRGFHG